MTTRRQYVLKETLISIVINTLLSIGFVFLAFHGRSLIPAKGRHGVLPDMIPQTFMVVLMSCLIPALLTRSRLLADSLAWQRMTFPSSPLRICLRAIGVALLMTGVVFAASWLVLPRLLPAGISFARLLTDKALFGMLLAAVATPWAIGRVLGRPTV